MVQNKKVLLHACCGICSAYPIKFLIENNYNPLIFFSNSNLDTQSEYNLRLNAQKKLCEYYKIELIIDNYLHDSQSFLFNCKYDNINEISPTTIKKK